MKLSSAQRQELRDVVLESGCLLESEKDDIVSSVVSWVEAQEEDQMSFSDILSRQNVEEPEPHKYPMRTDAVWTMQMLRFFDGGKGMTYLEIAEEKIGFGLSPKYAKDMTRHIGELRYWGLVEDTGERRGGCIVWRITQTGRDFLDGKCQVPSHLYILNKRRCDPPHGKENGHMIFVHEIKPQDFSELHHDWMRKTETPITNYAV